MRDSRYDKLKFLLQNKSLKSFSEIYDIIPKSVLKVALGTNTIRMERLVTDPSEFQFKDVIKIARKIGCDEKEFINFASEESRQVYRKKNPL